MAEDGIRASEFSFELAGIRLAVSGSETLIREIVQLLQTEILPSVKQGGIQEAGNRSADADEAPVEDEVIEERRTSGATPSPKAYFDEKQPKTEQEKAAVFACFLKLYRNKTEFTVQDLEKLHNEAHVPIKNVQNAIWNAGKKDRGWIRSVSGKRQVYHLTAAGENYVKTQLPRNK